MIVKENNNIRYYSTHTRLDPMARIDCNSVRTSLLLAIYSFADAYIHTYIHTYIHKYTHTYIGTVQVAYIDTYLTGRPRA